MHLTPPARCLTFAPETLGTSVHVFSLTHAWQCKRSRELIKQSVHIRIRFSQHTFSLHAWNDKENPLFKQERVFFISFSRRVMA